MIADWKTRDDLGELLLKSLEKEEELLFDVLTDHGMSDWHARTFIRNWQDSVKDRATFALCRWLEERKR